VHIVVLIAPESTVYQTVFASASRLIFKFVVTSCIDDEFSGCVIVMFGGAEAVFVHEILTSRRVIVVEAFVVKRALYTKLFPVSIDLRSCPFDTLYQLAPESAETSREILLPGVVPDSAQDMFVNSVILVVTLTG
jgi:hypothetical protein